MKRWVGLGIVALAAVSLVWLGLSPAALAQPKGKPIVIGYVGNVASPGTKPCMDIQKFAVEEINKAGGIMGRQIELIQDALGNHRPVAHAGSDLAVRGGQTATLVLQSPGLAGLQDEHVGPSHLEAGARAAAPCVILYLFFAPVHAD